MKALANCLDKTLYQKAELKDAPEILALQKTAYQSEAVIYGDDSLPELLQTLEELQKDFGNNSANGKTEAPAAQASQKVVLKAVVNAKIIGSIRGHCENGTAHLHRLIVHPYFRGRGIGRQLVVAAEEAFPAAKRFEALTGSKSDRNIRQLRKLGYQEFKTEQATPAISWVYMQKERS
ncbi:MAG: GNAT family N-acetyltransferase [Verrucomicrobiia bacterium]